MNFGEYSTVEQIDNGASGIVYKADKTAYYIPLNLVHDITKNHAGALFTSLDLQTPLIIQI